MFGRKQLKKSWKKKFYTIHQLVCFVAHPVDKTLYILHTNTIFLGFLKFLKSNDGFSRYFRYSHVYLIHNKAQCSFIYMYIYIYP